MHREFSVLYSHHNLTNWRLTLNSLLLCALTLTTASNSFADKTTPNTEQETLLAQINRQEALLTKNQEKLVAYEKRLDEARIVFAEAQKGAIQARHAHQQAAAAAAMNASENNQRALNMATRRLEIAEVKEKTRAKRVTRLNKSIQTLETSIFIAPKTIRKLKVSLRALHQNIAQTEPSTPKSPIPKQDAWAEKEAKLQIEIAKRQKRLAEEQRAKILTQSIKEKEANIFESADTSALEEKKSLPLSQDEKELNYVKGELRQLSAFLDEQAAGKPRYRKLRAYTRKSGTLNFEHLGRNQYYSLAELTKTENEIRFQSHQFRIKIPEEDVGKPHIILFDAYNDRDARLVVFKESHLNEIDASESPF